MTPNMQITQVTISNRDDVGSDTLTCTIISDEEWAAGRKAVTSLAYIDLYHTVPGVGMRRHGGYGMEPVTTLAAVLEMAQ